MSKIKKTKRRKVDLIVISDVHLGTFGSKAEELLNYLKTVEPKTVILNGDIIDIWQFSSYYFPKSHLKVIKYFTSLLPKETKVYYVTGNHDDMLRKFVGFRIGNFQLVNKVVLELDGKKAWMFHGDVFDVTMKHSKWLAKLGGKGYGFLILINKLVNWVSRKLGRGRISLSKKIKESVKGAVSKASNFEKTASDIAISSGYEYVVCGHIHKPNIKHIENEHGQSVLYLNSGDWVENLTALEYSDGQWSLYEYYKDSIAQLGSIDEAHLEKALSRMEYDDEQIFTELVKEFGLSDKSQSFK